MTLLVIVSLLAGMALSQRYKVLILLPAIGVAIVVAVAIGVARADQAWSIILSAVSMTASLQVGYLLGIGLRLLVDAETAAGLYRIHNP